MTSISPLRRRQVWEKTGGYCWYCADALEFNSYYEMDHVIPRSQGGTHDVENLVPSCPGCNREKGMKSLEEYRELQAHYRGWRFTKMQQHYLAELGIELPEPPQYWFAGELGVKEWDW